MLGRRELAERVGGTLLVVFEHPAVRRLADVLEAGQ